MKTDKLFITSFVSGIFTYNYAESLYEGKYIQAAIIGSVALGSALLSARYGISLDRQILDQKFAEMIYQQNELESEVERSAPKIEG